MDNQDTQATLYTRHRTKTNKIRDITLKTKKMNNTHPPKPGGDFRHMRKFIVNISIYL
jgi:hypothetical protein